MFGRLRQNVHYTIQQISRCWTLLLLVPSRFFNLLGHRLFEDPRIECLLFTSLFGRCFEDMVACMKVPPSTTPGWATWSASTTLEGRNAFRRNSMDFRRQHGLRLLRPYFEPGCFERSMFCGGTRRVGLPNIVSGISNFPRCMSGTGICH